MTMPKTAIAVVLVALQLGALLALWAQPAFEQTAPPPVSLEPVVTAPDNGDAQPPEVANAPTNLPDWWTRSRESLNQAIDAQAGDAAEAETTDTAASLTAGGLNARFLQIVAAFLFVLALLIVALNYVAPAFRNWIKRRNPLLAATAQAGVVRTIRLSSRAALHFVQVEDRMLVIGVTPTHIARIAEWDSRGKPVEPPRAAEPPQDGTSKPDAFLEQLKSLGAMPSTKQPDPEFDEIAALRGDIDRLQRYVQESVRELGN